MPDAHRDNKSSEPEPPHFSERDSLGEGMTGAGYMGAMGVVVSAIQNATQKHSAGAAGVFTRTGSTIALFTAVGAAFGFTESFVANTNGSSDATSSGAGGCAAGLVVGAKARSIPTMVSSCVGLGALLATFEAAGGTFRGAFQQSFSPIDKYDEHGNYKSREQMRDERRKKFFKNTYVKSDETESE